MLRNLTLATMHPDDFAAIRLHLFEREVTAGMVLVPQGEEVETVYFPATANLVNIVTFQDGRSAETFIMGVEGVAALAPFLAGLPCAWSVEGKTEGLVYGIAAPVLRAATKASERLMQQFLCLTADYQAQASLGVACSALHDMISRLARVIVMRAERGQTTELHLTQDDLAQMMGHHRSSIIAAAQALKEARAIRYSRGVIRIVDIALLRRMACECYRLQQSFTPRYDLREPLQS